MASALCLSPNLRMKIIPFTSSIAKKHPHSQVIKLKAILLDSAAPARRPMPRPVL